MTDFVMDASAILAILFEEPGHDVAMTAADDAAVSAVTIAEVATKLIDNGQVIDDIAKIIREFEFTEHALDSEQALDAAAIRGATRDLGLSLGDRACLALARRLRLPVVTADRAWARIADVVAVEVRLIR